MADQLVVINGAPGAGKTTLAHPLADALGGVLVAKDTIKEALAESVDAALPTSKLGALALDALWRIAGMVPGLVVVEGFWFPARDTKFFRAGYANLGSPPAVEVWVHAPLDVMRARYLTRDRHHAHDDAARIDDWEQFAVAAGPVSGFPVVEVDASVPVDPVALAERVESAFA